MEQFFSLFLLAVVVEATVTYVQEWFVNKNFNWKQILAAVFGVVVAIGYNLDFIAMFGLESSIPYLGTVLTGLAISRGSNFVADLVKQVQSYNTAE